MVRYGMTFADLTDYEACLPTDECSEVVVAGLPTDAYKLSFDGKAVDNGPAFPYDDNNPVTSTEVGTCTKPVCKDTEALLEILYWNGDFSHTVLAFRVEDKDGNTILQGEDPDESYSVNNTYACLPKDDSCYMFLIGGRDEWDANYSIIFDGKLVRRSDGWLFDSVQFGDSCERCNQDDESLVEFFMYTGATHIDEVGYEYEWDLNRVSNNSSASVVSGVVPIGPGTSPLTHKIMCIPKGSCSSFYISAPNVTREVVRLVVDDNSTSWENATFSNVTVNETLSFYTVYALAMDNVTYRKVTWRAPYDKFGSRSDNQTTNMGSCTVGGLCDEQTQDLLDLELHMPANYDETYAIFPYRHIHNSWIGWYFGYTNIGDGWYFLRSNHYNTHAYDLDSAYGVIECVPKGDCDLSFNITPKAPVESYIVKKNGIQLDDADAIYTLMTPFGQNCLPASNSLSGGAVAGIVIASVAAVGAVIFGSVWYKRRQNQSPNAKEGEEEEDPEA
eukprot:scaffold2953_cov132-Skeletonema_dohrnii-CCMP3373.AAC.3